MSDSVESRGAELVSEKLAKIAVTEEDKIKAIDNLRSDLKTYIIAQEKQDAVNLIFRETQKRMLTWIQWISIGQSLTMVIAFIFLAYFLTRPANATQVAMRFVSDQLLFISKENARMERAKEDLDYLQAALVDSLKAKKR